MTANNLERSTPENPNEEYEKWIQDDNGEILGEYKNICKQVSSLEKCLFSVLMFNPNPKCTRHRNNARNISDIIGGTSICRQHSSRKKNKVIAKYIKEKCKL